MKEQAVSHHLKDEISLLDILVTLAESWKLLIFGPLIAAVFAGVLSFLWPKTFESVTVLRLTEEDVALLHSAPVLDVVIEQFGLLAETNGIVDDARQALKQRISFSIDKKSKLVTIITKAGVPEQAQALGNAVSSALLQELQVKGQEKILLQKNIAINEDIIQNLEDASDSIQRSLKRGVHSDLTQESAIKNLVTINADIAKRKQENNAFLMKLDIKGADLFVQRPSLPQRKALPKRGIVMLLTLCASSFTLLLFVFIRKAWRSAALDAESASKIERIRGVLCGGAKL